MKRIWKVTQIIVVLAFVLIMVGRVVSLTHFPREKNVIKKNDPFESVKKYQPLLHDELAKDHLEKYMPVLLALMQQESKGKGGDPMQASESAGLAPNTINNAKKSIHKGVKHFQRVLAYGKQEGVDFPTIIQAYNMGIGYINYVKDHGGKHTEQLAKKFSLIQVQKKPHIYDCGGNKNNFRYPYCYGDFTYSTKVTQNIDSLTVPVSADGQKKSADESF